MVDSIKMYYSPMNEKPWEVRMNGKYAKVIADSLIEEEMPEESVIQTMRNAAEVLNYCPNPSSESTSKKTGIVIGKVQSGKTSNFISVTAMAFDNGYNIVVVFGGTKKILVKQNKDRIERYYQKAAITDIVILDTESNLNLLNAKTVVEFIRSGKKIIIIALKNKTQIGRIRDCIFSDVTLANSPTLIIDDEGDEASLNALVKKNKKTPTYEAIESLKNKLDKHCFISVTATPQANILINAIDVLSPDFGILVNPGEGYCGLDVFHSDDKFVKVIPDEDDLKGVGLPESFINALAMYFVACGVNQVRSGNPNSKVSMLVHESQLTEVHKEEFEKINDIISQWKTTILNTKDIAYQSDLRGKLLQAHSEYKNAGTKNLPQFEVLEDNILNAIRDCHAHIVNGSNGTNGDDRYFNYNIYIGGTLLGRGLTIRGLVITYITRTPKGKATVDTSEQRARWFGYKGQLLDLCRIFMVRKLEREFLDIRDHEEDLWDTVRHAQLQGNRFKDIVRIFTLSDGLKMTRTSVAETETFKFTYWNKQRLFQTDSDLNASNQKILLNLKKEHPSELEVLHFGKGAPYTILRSDFNYIKANLFDLFIFPAEEPKINAQIIMHISKALHKHKLNPKVEVIWMRDLPNETSDHEIKDGNRIPNYSVGRRPLDVAEPQIYAGDDKQFCKDGIIQVQIHNIRDKKSGIVSPTLALYMPDDIVAILANLVCRA